MKKTTILSLLLSLLLSIVAVGFSSCGGDEKTYSFNYLEEDLTKYVQISQTDYKGYTLTVKLGGITDKSVEEQIMQTLYEHRSDEAENPGRTAPLSIGDTLEMWYRGYVKDEDGTETEVSGFSNMASSSAYKLGIGSAKLPLGVESSLVGVVIADYSSLEDAKKSVGDIITENDIIYVSYSLLSATDGQTSKSGVRIDLSDEGLDAVYGTGFRNAFIGKTVPETTESLQSFTTSGEGGSRVYKDVKISTVYPKDANYLTVEARLPYDYEDYELAGNTIYFDIFPHYFTAYSVPELNESFILDTLELDEEQLAGFEGDTLVEKYKALVKEELSLSREEQLASIKEEAMWYHYNDKALIIEYPEDALMAVYTVDVSEIELVWSQYKDSYPDLDDFACAYLSLDSGADWKEHLMENARREVKEKLIFYYIIKTEGLLAPEGEYDELYDKLFDEYVDYYLDGKTAEDYDSEEKYAEARKNAEEAVLEYYGEDFFVDQVYYEYALGKILDFAVVEIIE